MSTEPQPLVAPVIWSLRSQFDNLKTEIFNQLNCHEVGQIVAFDATKQTASVQVMVLRNMAGVAFQYPLLTDCPVFFPSGGGASLRFPVAAGDPCLVLFNDRDIDNWFTTGNNALPNSKRAHDLSDGLVLVGFRNLANKLADFSATDLELVNGDAKISLAPDGTATLTGAEGSSVQIDSSGNITIDATTGKVALKNDAQTLATLIQDTFTVLAASNLDSTTKTALALIKIRFAALLDP